MGAEYVRIFITKKSKTPKVFCDTSVLVPFQTRKILVSAAAGGEINPYWSPWILAELNRVLTWKWIVKDKGSEKECSIQSKKMMRYMLPYFRIVDPVPPYLDGKDVIPDPDDLPVWAAAKKINAKFLISNNTKDFPPANTEGLYIYEGIEWITAKKFIERFELV